MKPTITRIRLLTAEHGVDGRPSLYKGIVMSGAKVVASTSNIRDAAVCLCLTQALESSYRVAQRSGK